MKITRNSLKELIRQSIDELKFKDKAAFDKYDKKHKMKADTKVSIGGKDTTVGQAIDVGGPSHPNVPKKKKGGGDDFLVPGAGDPGDVGIGDLPDPSTRRGKPDNISSDDWNNMDADEREYHTSGEYEKDSEMDDTGMYDEPYTDDDEDHGGGGDVGDPKWDPDAGDEDEFDVGGPSYPNVPKGAKTSKQAKQMLKKKKKKSKKESVKESSRKSIKTTVKEVKQWMRTLEENRYKKTYNSDARRVSWMVNHMGESVENMPVSMRKKWSKAQYGRERYLAKEYVKHLNSKELTEGKIRKIIRKVIKEQLNEAKRRELEIHVRDKIKVDKILKKLRLKSGKDYDIGAGSSRSFMLDVDVKHLDNVITIFMKNRISVK